MIGFGQGSTFPSLSFQDGDHPVHLVLGGSPEVMRPEQLGWQGHDSTHGPEIQIDARPRVAEGDDRDLWPLGRWDTPDERTSRIDVCGCVGQLECDRLVQDDRLAACHAILGVIQSDLVGAPCDTRRLRPDRGEAA